MSDDPSPLRPRGVSLAATIALVCGLELFALVVVRCAWLSEDAYITFRVIDNFSQGYGLRWNIVERVQPYTHPLWMLVLLVLRSVSGEIFYTALYTSITTSLLAAVLLAFRIARHRWVGVLAVLVMIASKSFVDFSTSGLENPLTHLLLVIFACALFSPTASFRLLAFTGGLLVLNRMDSVLLVLPVLLSEAVGRVRSDGYQSAAVDLLIGFAPFVVWEAFAVFYYGFPFPNSAYAKLQTGLPTADMIRQGWNYIRGSVRLDPVLAVALPLGLLAGMFGTERRARWLALGVLLHLFYVVRVGGDFMAGRFLTPTLFGALLLLCRWRPPAIATLWNPALCAGAVLLFLVAGVSCPFPPLTSGLDYGVAPRRLTGAHGIADERGYYFQYASLWRALRGEVMPSHPWIRDGIRGRESGYRVLVVPNIGFYGYYAGPSLHIIDPLGLADPLLARLPVRTDTHWRIGHFERAIPAGYRETVVDPGGEVHLSDPELAELYRRIAIITRGPLFSGERFREILRLNLEP